MTVKIEFGTGNDAFYPDIAAEASRILHEIAESVGQGSEAGDIRDINGNLIGHYIADPEASE